MKEFQRLGKKQTFGEVDLRSPTALQEIIEQRASYIFDEKMDPENVCIYFPAAYWRKPKRKADPLDLHMSFLDDDLTYRISFRESLSSLIESCREDTSYSEGLLILADAFEKLAFDLKNIVSESEKKFQEEASPPAHATPAASVPARAGRRGRA